MLLLREAAHGAEHAPKLWVLYAVQCARVGRFEEVERALAHAAWLRDRAHEPGKARVTRALTALLSETRAA